MYKSFFGLQTFPFRANPDPRFLCMTPQTREVLACLQYGIAERKGFVVMTGEVGTGKTTLLKSVLASFPERLVSTAYVFNPRLDTLDFLEFVLTDFGIPPRERTKSSMLLQLNSWLIQRYREQALCVIVVDEAQNLSQDLLEEIRLLTNLETSSEKLVQIILSGQPELEDLLRLASLRQLRQRIALWCRTRPLSIEETRAYIAARICIAGGEESVFASDAVELIYGYSMGIPRVVNLICEHAMIHAYVEQIKPIPARIIESVTADLNLQDQPLSVGPAASSVSCGDSLTTAVLNVVAPGTDTTNSQGEQGI